jgi:hypothetical protein
MQQALTGLGAGATMVEQAELPELPPPRTVRRIDCLAQVAQVYDGMGRQQTLAWDQVLLIAAGNVGCFQELAVPAPTLSHYRTLPAAGYYVRAELEGTSSVDHRQVSCWQWVLEIHGSVGAARYRAILPDVLFTYLGPRLTSDRDTNFRLLLADLLRLAPKALINRGANMLTQEPPETVKYDSRPAFEKELRWLLWWGRHVA